jgi:hypothetical protein
MILQRVECNNYLPQSCLVYKRYLDQPRDGKAACDRRYEFPPSNDLLRICYLLESAATTITIRYKSQFSLKPHDTLPLLDELGVRPAG